jgi:hypothetical protein
MMKTCIACGMPMNEVSEFAMGDESKDYCVYCARPDGSMRSFEENREGMADFVVRTQGCDRTVALDIAEAMMKKLPAWQEASSHQ